MKTGNQLAVATPSGKTILIIEQNVLMFIYYLCRIKIYLKCYSPVQNFLPFNIYEFKCKKASRIFPLYHLSRDSLLLK